LTAKDEEFLINTSGGAVDIDPTVGNLFRSNFSSKHNLVRGLPSASILQKIVNLAVGGQFPVPISRMAPLSQGIALIADLESGKRVPGKAVMVMS